ncbi:unnamed protein product [Linum trigynum]|uniref:Uncharacterized protein n=1 Tax=Linum trigynum TaxID=586398 RepID=A0AAV2CHB2_9ROSI
MYAGEYTESTSSPAAATVTSSSSSSSSPKFAIDGSKSIHSHRSTQPPPWSWPSRTSHIPQMSKLPLRMPLEFFPIGSPTLPLIPTRPSLWPLPATTAARKIQDHRLQEQSSPAASFNDTNCSMRR